MCWSSGKDSAWCLSQLRARDDVEVVALLTTFNQTADRVAMHAVRRQLVEAQAKAAGLPLTAVELSWPSSNADYETAMRGGFEDLASNTPFDQVAFGDLFLEDVRAYREQQLGKLGLRPTFPLWGLDTATLARRMIDAGVQATITCVDPKQCPASFAGRSFDHALLDELPESVDPCGENGEFHTFVSHCPAFAEPVSVTLGQRVERDGFVFVDLVASQANGSDS